MSRSSRLSRALQLPLGYDRETGAGADPIRASLQHSQRRLPISNSSGSLHLHAAGDSLFHQPHIFHRRTGSAETRRRLHIVGSCLHNQLAGRTLLLLSQITRFKV